MPRPIAKIVADLVDANDCEFDHHGGCQMHGYLDLEPGEMCPQAEAKQWLAARPPKRTATAEAWREFLRNQDIDPVVFDLDYATRTDMIEWWEEKHNIRRMDPIDPFA